MISCFWYSAGICKGTVCPLLDCEDYLDMNSPRGKEVSEIYERHIQEALIPIHDRMKRLFKFKEK